MQRRLTAILAADVVGYSGLMEADEAGTLQRLKVNRSAVFDPCVQAHDGRLVKLMGDGALVEFASVTAAVNCALALQLATANAEPERAEEARLRYRIGINLGDVIVDGDDIYGEGVNVAARLQALAPAGGIALSATVRDHVAGKVACVFEDVGQHTVKGIQRPVHVFVLHAPAAAETPARGAADAPLRMSVCVLPFANMSGDPEQEYFSDGITEDIITDLCKVSALAVVSRNTSFTFKGKHVAVAQVARQLKVSHVLEGSVRKAGNRVRITAQLIEGATDSHLWAERYDRDLNDIFALQDEISQAIVGALKLRLLPAEKKAIEHRATTNPEAYKLYLMARQYNATGNSRHREITVRLCKRAVEIDPGYARAWALLAICQSNMRLLVSAGTGETGWEAALQALALEPDLAEAHAAKGRVLADAGKLDEGWVEHEIALRLDPDAYEVNAAAARCLLAMHRWDDAIACLERAATAIESDFWALGMCVQAHLAKGDADAAKATARRNLERIEKAIIGEPDHSLAMGWGVSSLVALGEVERAKEWAARAMLLDPDNSNLRYNLGCSMVALGDFDAAIEMLTPVLQVFDARRLIWWRTDTDLDPIRDDPRFKAMIASAVAHLAATE
jgi:adenylate cyclase